MATNRQDAWSEGNDQLLADIVLDQIRSGGTQLTAFKLVSEKLDRTPAACGFRWNSAVRKQYRAEIEKAKIERKSNKGKSSKSKNAVKLERTPQKSVANRKVNNEKLQKILEKLRNEIRELERISEEMLNLNRKNEDYEKLFSRCNSLQIENERLNRELSLVETDYKAFMSVLDRARVLTLKESK